MLFIKQILAKETYPLRLSVLKTCDEYVYQYQGDFDKRTVHFGVFSQDILVGIVTVMEKIHHSLKGKQFQLRGMAVHKSFQKKGIGAKLVEKVKAYCIEQKTSFLWCNAREKAVSFYKKQGFKAQSDVFYIEHVGNHFMMVFGFHAPSC